MATDYSFMPAGALAYIKVFKQMDPFRSDPRYIGLLKRMGLPQ
jgi:hypothetical protein